MKVFLFVMGFSALLGGLDRIAGNRLGLGKAFEEGMRALGPQALSMAGILCIAPLMAQGAAYLAPLCRAIGMDPAALASPLALDMGGYQMAVTLADDPAAGRFFGVLAGAIAGCTLSFTIPAGMGLYGAADQRLFARGILYGLIAMPIGLLAGALTMGIAIAQALWLCAPLLLLAVMFAALLHAFPRQTAAGFAAYAALLRVIATLGLALGAFQHISGVVLLPGMTPLSESLSVVAAIGIALTGSLPAAELLRRALRRPLAALGDGLGIGGDGVLSLLLLYVNVTPGLASLPGISARGKVVASAFAVSAASCLTAHLAFTLAMEPQMAGPMIAGKTAGALAAAAMALLLTRGMDGGEAQDV